MAAARIGVGIVGVEPGRSFAAVAHIPALQALPQFKIVAISTTKMHSARAAAERYGIKNAYDHHAALIADPEVDLVAVTVKVAHHFEIVSAALEAGKPVYCEWPLALNVEQAEQMAELARRKKIYAAVGLQTRSAPALGFVRDLIANGYVGEVLSTSVIGAGLNWGAVMDAPNAYTADKRNGATMLAIPVGHMLDALCYSLGELREVTAQLTSRRKSAVSAESGAIIAMTAEDQVAFAGRLQSEAVISLHYRGGMTRGTGLLWEINGTAGDLQVTAMGGHPQLFDLSVRGATGEDSSMHPLEVPKKYRWAPEVAPMAYNVAQAYVRVAEDLRAGTQTVPGFAEAVERHRSLAAIERSARDGAKVTID